MDLVPKEYRQKESEAGFAGKKSGFSLSRTSLNFSSEKKDGLLKAGVILSALVFVLSCLFWGGLKYYQNSLAARIDDIRVQQDKIFQAKDKELARNIVDFETGAALIQNLLKNHVYTSEITEKLSALTLPQVQWHIFSLDVKAKSILVKGRAANYSVVARQILAFEEGGFSNVAVSGINMDRTGGVAFQLEAGFDPKSITNISKNE